MTVENGRINSFRVVNSEFNEQRLEIPERHSNYIDLELIRVLSETTNISIFMLLLCLFFKVLTQFIKACRQN